MSKLYIISGCNGAGKTTASFTILPEILNCKEFVNADGIAAGLSPFNPEKVAFEAGRIMLQRIHQLMEEKVDFAFETTLSTRSYIPFVKQAKALGYEIDLFYFWLNSPEFAKKRVVKRVRKGGHNIPDNVIERRYYRGLSNFFNLFVPIVDNWIVFDNMHVVPEIIANGSSNGGINVINSELWNFILTQRDIYGK